MKVWGVLQCLLPQHLDTHSSSDSEDWGSMVLETHPLLEGGCVQLL